MNPIKIPVHSSGAVQIATIIPTQSGFSVLSTIEDVSDKSVCGLARMPVIAWAFDDNGFAYPVTPHGIDFNGPLPAILYPTGEVDDSRQSWNSESDWLLSQIHDSQGGRDES